MQQKKVPMRKCMGCNVQKNKAELVRIVRSADGEISVDLTGKKNGRGAYICNNKDCLGKVRKTGRLNRILETEIPQKVYDVLERELGNNVSE